MNVLNDIILFVCFNQLRSRRTYGKLGYMVMRQVAIKANIFLAAFPVLIICACADDPDALKSIGTDRLSPPSSLICNYILVESSDPNMDGGTFAITADDYQKVADGEVLFSLKEYIGEVPFKLLGQSRSTTRWILYFPDEEWVFDAAADGMVIRDTYKGNTIISYYEKIYNSGE